MNTVNELRDKLFSTIEKLENGEIKREDAIAISNIAQVFINTIKVEVEAAKVFKEFKPTNVFDSLALSSPTVEIKQIAKEEFRLKKDMRVEIMDTGKTGIIESVNNLELKATVKTNIGRQEVEFENIKIL